MFTFDQNDPVSTSTHFLQIRPACVRIVGRTEKWRRPRDVTALVNWWLSSTGLAAGTSSPNAFVPLRTPEPLAPSQL